MNNRKANFLKKTETPLHFIKLEEELLAVIEGDKENIIRVEV